MTTPPKPLTHREISKFLSHVLRHAPETIGISLDANGWVDIADLLSKSKKAGKRFDRATLDLVVAQNDKQRFTICDKGLKIRAAQGHSVTIDLDLTPQEPPAIISRPSSKRVFNQADAKRFIYRAMRKQLSASASGTANQLSCA